MIIFTLLSLLMGYPQAMAQDLDFDLPVIEKVIPYPFACVCQESPHAGLTGPSPSFRGCYDYHSGVHGIWALVRYLRVHSQLGSQETEWLKTVNSRVHFLLKPEHLTEEFEFLKLDTLFENPYGRAWFLRLALEYLLTFPQNQNPTSALMLQLADQQFKILSESMEKQSQPVRQGLHDNTAFALWHMRAWAEASNSTSARAEIQSLAMKFFETSAACANSDETLSGDFLSPCLTVAHLMAQILPESDFRRWISRFLPRPDDFLKKLKTSIFNTDFHRLGLISSRSWALYDLSHIFPENPLWKLTFDRHTQAFIEQIPLWKDNFSSGSHWIGQFDLMALTAPLNSDFTLNTTNVWAPDRSSLGACH